MSNLTNLTLTQVLQELAIQCCGEAAAYTQWPTELKLASFALAALPEGHYTLTHTELATPFPDFLYDLPTTTIAKWEAGLDLTGYGWLEHIHTKLGLGLVFSTGGGEGAGAFSMYIVPSQAVHS
jgi:hypothetical protein